MGKITLFNFALIFFSIPCLLKIEFLCWQVKDMKGMHLDDSMDTIRQKILIKWNHRKRVAQKFEGKILPHIVQKLRGASYNLDIEVITSSPDGIAEVCAKGSSASSFRFVVVTPDFP
jgi:hypothetical protein